MHVPDGFLDLPTAAAMGTISVAGLAVALRQANRNLPPRQVPMLGLSAAFIFAGQMINFPVPGGTSGHLLGGTLAAVLLGPSPAVISLSAVLIVQCLLFADGGITALGANLFNMALVGGVGGWFIYRGISRILPGLRGRLLGAAFAAWCTTVLAAVACAAQLAISGTVPWSLAFATMANVHMVIGIGEALITAMVLASIAAVRPEIVDACSEPAPARTGELLIYGLLLSLGLAIFVSPLASSLPDGLEHTAELLGFAARAAEAPILSAPAADYTVPGIGSIALATSLAGGVGTIVVFILTSALARALAPRPASADASVG
jgi:cobalt/nickel transport system permease protein